MKIELDQFELLYYLEGCARGSHLRQGVWRRCIDEFYDKLTTEERQFVFHYSVRDLWLIFNEPYIGDSKHCGREDFNLFLARFNPYNKYKVTASNGTETNVCECFWFNDRFYNGSNSFIGEDYIKDIEWVGKEDSELYEKQYSHLGDKVEERVELKPPYKD